MEFSNYCTKCKHLISKTAGFCTKCGTPQIKNTIIHEKSTASYDPGSLELKPWRERGALATNHWRDRVSNVSVSVKAPWRPPMKQYKVDVKPVKGEKPPTVPWPEDMVKKKSVVVVWSSPKQTVSLSTAKTVKYRGRIWAKPGEKKRNRKTLFSQENLYTKATLNIPPDLVEDDDIHAPEQLFSLGVYMADWLDLSHSSQPTGSGAKPERTMTSVHISLYEHFRESTLGQHISTRWLRVGYVVDRLEYNPLAMERKSNDCSCDEMDDQSCGGGDMIVLDFLPNEVAKCMGVFADDWVDLKYIDPNNSYMVAHLQGALCPIASRVIVTSPRTMTEDQVCRVDCSVSRSRLRYGDEEDDVPYRSHAANSSVVGVSRLMDSDAETSSCVDGLSTDEIVSLVLVDEAGEAVGSPDSGQSESIDGQVHTQRLEEVRLDKTVAQITMSIPLGCYHLNRMIPSMVRMEIHWMHDRVINAERQHLHKDGDIDDDDDDSDNVGGLSHRFSKNGNSSIIDGLTSFSSMNSGWHMCGPVVEGVTLRVYPTYANGVLLPPKRIYFTVDSLLHLIDCDAFVSPGGPTSSTEHAQKSQVDEFMTIRSYSNNTPAGIHIMTQLDQGPRGARHLCQQIARVMRYEYTTEGVKLMVHGAEVPFEICKSDEVKQLEADERSRAATKIQSMQRGISGRARVKGIRNDRERWDFMLKVTSTKTIQRVIRGFLGRSRVARIREEFAKECQRYVEIPLSSPPSEKIKMEDGGLEVCLNGTDVVIVVSLSGGGDVLVDDCIIKVIERDTSKAASLVITSTIMQRLWEKYKSLPLKFEHAQLRIRRIRTANLKNVELFGQNDPFVVMTFGDLWSGQTSTIQDGGTDVEWEILEEEQRAMQFQVCPQDLMDSSLKVCVSDENKFRSHVLIGETSIDLIGALDMSAYKTEIAFSGQLTTSRGKDAGTVTVSVELYQTDDKGDLSSASLVEAWAQRCVRESFIVYVAKNHIDLFLSRSSSVMLVRLKPQQYN